MKKLTEEKFVLEYENGRTCGQIAKEYKCTVGEIGCRNCGAVTHGMLNDPNCPICGHEYFPKNEIPTYL